VNFNLIFILTFGLYTKIYALLALTGGDIITLITCTAKEQEQIDDDNESAAKTNHQNP
jgi:hypothetical protein